MAQESSVNVATAAQALPVAAEAKTIAESAETAANSAVSTANAASTTAGDADTKADNAVSTANAASTSADNAVAVANAASAAVSAVVDYTLVADVASIPSSPSDGDRVEVDDSTGIESFSPLSGIPSGFVGDSALSVRLNYDSSNSEWVFLQYLVLDPDNRYVTLDGTADKSDRVFINSTGFGTNSSRPIACFGGSSTPTAGGYSTLKYAGIDPPIIRGDGRLSAPGGFKGNLTGDVSGDVTGSLVGDVTGNVAGNVIGNLTGNVNGNVTGDLEGNADTATQADNASTLDNLDSSQFLRSDINDPINGRITFAQIADFTKVGNALKLFDDCKLGLGSGNDAEFYVDGSHAYLDLNSGIGNFYIRDGSTARFTFNDNGDFSATGDITATGKITADSFQGELGQGQVRNAIAGGSAGAVGTYAMLKKTSAGNANPGAVVEGSELAYSNGRGSITNTTVNGKWQCMGFADTSFPAESLSTLWLRVE